MKKLLLLLILLLYAYLDVEKANKRTKRLMKS